MQHVIVNKETGEFDDNCSVCSIGLFSADADFEIIESLQCDDTHSVFELTEEEYRLMNSSMDMEEVTRTKKVYDPESEQFVEISFVRLIPHYSLKVDISKAQKRIVQRDRVDVPIEVEGIGGKEIIGYETKPVGIVVERELSTKKEEAGRD